MKFIPKVALMGVVLLIIMGLAFLIKRSEKEGMTKMFSKDSRVPGMEIRKDIAYLDTDSIKLYLDMYWNARIKNPVPLIVWVHGGGWEAGDKAEAEEMAPMILEKGYALASVNYRLSDEAHFPAQIMDCKAAIRWLRAHAGDYNIDPESIGVWGSSAGGHLVSLLGTTSEVEEWDAHGEYREVSSEVQAVCDWFGPTDMFSWGTDSDWTEEDLDSPEFPPAKLIGGPVNRNREKAEALNPIMYVSGNEPPFLIMHGKNDRVVPPEHSILLDSALSAGGTRSDLMIIGNQGHGGRMFDGYQSTVLAFFDAHLKKETMAQRSDYTPPPGIELTKDITYCRTPERDLKLDLYWHRDQLEPMPLIVWVHGGGWRGGNKRSGQRIAENFIEKGYNIASVSYRLSQEAIFPSQIIDCKGAIRWLRANAIDYNIDPDRIGAWGSSAGGHLVSLLGTTSGESDWDAFCDYQQVTSDVQAVCDWFGPTDFLRMNDTPGKMDHNAPDSPESLLIGAPIQENPDKVKMANPITYITGDEPPFLIMHGDQDSTVLHSQSVLFDAALRKQNVDVTFFTVEGAGHGGPKFEEHLHLVEEFFNKHLKNIN